MQEVSASQLQLHASFAYMLHRIQRRHIGRLAKPAMKAGDVSARCARTPNDRAPMWDARDK